MIIDSFIDYLQDKFLFINNVTINALMVPLHFNRSQDQLTTIGTPKTIKNLFRNKVYIEWTTQYDLIMLSCSFDLSSRFILLYISTAPSLIRPNNYATQLWSFVNVGKTAGSWPLTNVFLVDVKNSGHNLILDRRLVDVW